MSKKQVEGAGVLRIIGGEWGSRRLRFPAAAGLRPTPDRIRETVFNWLAPYIEAANCLDLFAGTGALGLEALSRGAASVQFVEKQKKVVRALRDNLSLLNAEAPAAQLQERDALAFLKNTISPLPFDLVFLDPPYHSGLLQQAINALDLKSGAIVYLEYAQDDPALQLPDSWQPLKQRQGGQVVFCLYQVA